MDEYENLYARNNIVKKNSRYEILNHLYFGPNFFFSGTALGLFSRCFSSSVNHGSQNFYSALNIYIAT